MWKNGVSFCASGRFLCGKVCSGFSDAFRGTARTEATLGSGPGKHPHRQREKKKQEENEESSRSKQTRKLLRRSVFFFALCECVCAFVRKRSKEKSQQEKEDRNENNNNLKQKQQQQSSEKGKKQSAAYFGFRTVFDSRSTSLRGTELCVFCYLLTPRSRTRRSIHQCQPCQIR